MINSVDGVMELDKVMDHEEEVQPKVDSLIQILIPNHLPLHSA